jgi:predicted amidohydrolase
MIIDARGDVVAAAGREETVLVGETDLALSSEMRSLIPVFGDRREELY